MDPKKHRKVLKYYERHTMAAPLAFAWAAMRAGSNAEKLGWINRQRDYLRLRDDASLLNLHRRLHGILADAARQWSSYDYGEGYFYQGCRDIGLSGLRDTGARLDAMRLKELVAGKTVLEIGCNTGFVSLGIAATAASVTGFDINPYLIEVARAVAGHLGARNVRFEVSRFETWDDRAGYDAVLSFANHSTYDENTSQGIAEYFRRCASLVRPGGRFVFESHPPAHEGKGLAQVVREIERHFEISERRVLDYGTFLDRARTFIVATRR